jgi:hypothetical protein
MTKSLDKILGEALVWLAQYTHKAALCILEFAYAASNAVEKLSHVGILRSCFFEQNQLELILSVDPCFIFVLLSLLLQNCR